MAKDTLTVTDNRIGRRYEIPIEHGAIRAADLPPLGLVSYDPAFVNTASCTSRITYIDGDAGIPHYRGYPIEQLAEQSTFLEPAHFLAMMFKMTELKYRPDPLLERALDVLFILHADHEQNCSTNTMRSIGSSQADPFSALAGACAALYGRLHGGANEAVLRMLAEIG